MYAYALWFEFFGRLIDPNFCIIHYYCCFMSQYLFEILKHKQHVYGNAHFETSQSNDNSNTKRFMFLLENEKRYWHLWDNEFVIQEMRMPLFIHIHRVLCILKPNHFRSFRVQTAYTRTVYRTYTTIISHQPKSSSHNPKYLVRITMQCSFAWQMNGNLLTNLWGFICTDIFTVAVPIYAIPKCFCCCCCCC